VSARRRAERAHGEKDYRGCAKLFLEAAASAPEFQATTDLYNAACCQALAGDRDCAFQSLRQALDRGIPDLVQVDRWKADADLKGLHHDVRWKRFVADAEAKAKAALANANEELAALYREDQADRQGGLGAIIWASFGRRDAARRKRVREILQQGGAKVAADFFHAAMVFQHGDDLDDFQTAHELAVKATELDPNHDTARWLAAAAKDRWLMHSGKPQWYGTQYVMKNWKWALYEVDPSISDAERASWNVPALSESKRRADEMNRR
jgi:hypothetical protein